MIDNLCKHIRDLINHPYKLETLIKDSVKWNMLTASLDVIEDTNYAMESYVELSDFKADKNGYLYTYGIMQAFMLQQDALNHFSISLFDEEINYKKDYPEIYSIRELRHNSVGHPSKGDYGKSFHFIGRASISKKGFDLLSYFPKDKKDFKLTKINVIKFIETQREIVADKLKEMITQLESDFESHKSKFKDKKLSDLIHPSIGYQFSKLYENINRDYDLVEMNFKSIIETYDKIKAGIIERYFSLTALSGIQLTTERLDYIFLRLKRDLIENKINDKLELEILIDALKSHFNELQEMLKEIDEKFK